MSKSFTLIVAGLGLAAALVSYKLGELGGAANAKDALTTAQSEALLVVKPYKDALARRTAGQRAAETERGRLRDSIRILTRTARRADSVAAAAPDSVPLALDAALRWRDVAEACDAESAAAGVAIQECTARALLAERRVDTLTAQLGAQVLVGSCRINLLLWRPVCPSRTTLFLFGVAAGGGAALVLQ